MTSWDSTVDVVIVGSGGGGMVAALATAGAGADALVVQGVEAGGHRGVFADDAGQSELSVLAALQLVGGTVDLPLIGAGSIMTGGALAAVLVAGAAAGQLGTAYLRCPEA
ncbi:MAG: nitronate monooxygenase, partial [Acidimicrobiales bacterium]